MNIKKLDTKYIKILTTNEQRKIIISTLKQIMKEYQVKEGRALELLSLYYKSGN